VHAVQLLQCSAVHGVCGLTAVNVEPRRVPAQSHVRSVAAVVDVHGVRVGVQPAGEPTLTAGRVRDGRQSSVSAVAVGARGVVQAGRGATAQQTAVTHVAPPYRRPAPSQRRQQTVDVGRHVTAQRAP